MIEFAPLSAPEPLGAHHVRDGFDCGNGDLNFWLKRRALANQASGATRTFVVCRRNRVVAYSALAAGAISSSSAPGRIRRNMPDPIPALVLARLAVDLSEQGNGIGAALLKDMLLRARRASQEHGLAAVLVHAIDENARRFYSRFGFLSSSTEALTLYARLADIENALKPP